jgi:transposase
MIPVPTGVRIWVATGATDMRKGMQGLALLVQESLGRDPFAGDVFVFRGRGGSLIKALWHDGIGLPLYAKRLDRGRFVWPVTVGGVVGLAAAQMSYLLEAIGWRNPQHTWHCARPFADVEEMDRTLRDCWNATVGPGDDVIVLGDFAYRLAPTRLRRLFDNLSGRKHLIIGNHDDRNTLELPWASPPRDLVSLSLDG